MNVALLIGRGGSTGLPGKNLMHLVGRPMMDYPILAARNARIDRIFLSTDDEAIARNGERKGCERIERPPELASDDALPEDAFRHGYREIVRRLGSEPRYVVLLFCNGVTITPGRIDEGFDFLDTHLDFDSAVTVSRYDMWSPLRARKIDGGQLKPYVPGGAFEPAQEDRDAQDAAWFVDGSAFVVRPRCFDYERLGDATFPFIGQRVHPLRQWGGLDVDFGYQVGQAEYWLREHGFSETRTPYEARTPVAYPGSPTLSP